MRAALGLLLLLAAGGSQASKPAATRPDAKAAPAKLLVVAPARFRAALATYVEAKRKDLPTEAVDLESALAAGSGADDAERLKRYMWEAWRRRGVRYALLVGDADCLPVRYMVLDRVTKEAFDFAFYPCDLYYADLAKPDGSFDDWNARKEGFHAGYVGEVRGEANKNDPINYDEVDYRPEIAVGRWPVSTPEEAAAVAKKTLAHDAAIAAAGSAPRRAGLVAIEGWVDCKGFMDARAAEVPAGWSAVKLYSGGAAPPDEPHISALLDEGVGLLLHAGHGYDDGWEGGFSSNAISKLKNAAHLPVVLSAGCSTARFATLPPYEAYLDSAGKEHPGTTHGEKFDAPPPPPHCYQTGKYNLSGLGEKLVRAPNGGAVAYIGCNTGSQPAALTLLAGFTAALGRAADAHPRLGDLWVSSLANYFEVEHLATLKPNADWYPPSIFFQGMKFMCFGDPTLRL